MDPAMTVFSQFYGEGNSHAFRTPLSTQFLCIRIGHIRACSFGIGPFQRRLPAVMNRQLCFGRECSRPSISVE